MAKTRAELLAENLVLRRHNRAMAIASAAGTFIRWAGACFIAYWGYRSIAVLAGRDTFANIGIRFLADLRVSEAVAWIFGGSGMLYGLREARLRKDTVQRLSPRIKELEAAIDPKRSSSGLSPRGDDPAEE